MDYDSIEWKEGLRRLQEAQTEIVKLRQRLARYEPQAESSNDCYGMQVVAWYYEIAGERGLSFAPDSNPYKPWVPLYAEAIELESDRTPGYARRYSEDDA